MYYKNEQYLSTIYLTPGNERPFVSSVDLIIRRSKDEISKL